MSWRIEAEGNRQEVMRGFDSDPQLLLIPVETKEAIRHLISSVGSTPRFRLLTSGHIDSVGQGNLEIKLEPIS